MGGYKKATMDHWEPPASKHISRVQTRQPSPIKPPLKEVYASPTEHMVMNLTNSSVDIMGCHSVVAPLVASPSKQATPLPAILMARTSTVSRRRFDPSKGPPEKTIFLSSSSSASSSSASSSSSGADLDVEKAYAHADFDRENNKKGDVQIEDPTCCKTWSQMPSILEFIDACKTVPHILVKTGSTFSLLPPLAISANKTCFLFVLQEGETPGYLLCSTEDLPGDLDVNEFRKHTSWVNYCHQVPNKAKFGILAPDGHFKSEIWTRNPGTITGYGSIRWYDDNINILHDFGERFYVPASDIICQPVLLKFLDAMDTLLVKIKNNFSTELRPLGDSVTYSHSELQSNLYGGPAISEKSPHYKQFNLTKEKLTTESCYEQFGKVNQRQQGCSLHDDGDTVLEGFPISMAYFGQLAWTTFAKRRTKEQYWVLTGTEPCNALPMNYFKKCCPLRFLSMVGPAFFRERLELDIEGRKLLCQKRADGITHGKHLLPLNPKGSPYTQTLTARTLFPLPFPERLKQKWREDKYRLVNGFPSPAEYKLLSKYRPLPQPCQKLPYEKWVTPLSYAWNHETLVEDPHPHSLWFFPGSLFRSTVNGLYAQGIWNKQMTGVAGNKHQGCTAVYVGEGGSYPDQFVRVRDLWYIDYHVNASTAKLLRQSALKGQAFGIFLGPHLKGEWEHCNTTEHTLYYSNVYITEEQVAMPVTIKDKLIQLFRFRLHPTYQVASQSPVLLTSGAVDYRANFTLNKLLSLNNLYVSTVTKFDSVK